MSTERYEIKKKLGEGGAGAVYIAHDTRLDREVAIKRVATEQGGWSLDTVDSMLKEARMLSSITHPNIVTIFDADVDGDGPYVVMELLMGRNIDDLIAENTLTISDFEDFATQCLEALIAAHSLDLIHRDIKPNNIVLKWLPSGKFQAKLLDFGMAKLTKEPTKQTVDQTDSVFGSIYFMAPEQFERTELDDRTDLYALGSVFYYTLTGYYPFTGDSPAEVMASHLTHRVSPLAEARPDLPSWLSNWVMWLLNREMAHRPESAQAALDLFQSHLSKAPLKTTTSVSTKFDETAKQEYFGQVEKEGLSINKAATKSELKAGVLAPVILGDDGTLTLQEGNKVPVAAITETVSVPTPAAVPAATSQQAKLNTGAAATVKLATPTPTAKQAAPAPADQPKTVQLATPKAAVVPATTQKLESPKAAAVPAATQKLESPKSPAKAQAMIGKTQAPANTNAVGSAKGPTKIKKVASKNPSGEPIELPGAGVAPAKSNNGLFAILAMVVVALIAVGVLLFWQIGESKKNERLNALLEPARGGATELPTTSDEVSFMLSYLYEAGGQVENNLLYKRLAIAESSDGNDLDYKIAEFATQTNSEVLSDVRSALFRVLSTRNSESTLPVIQEFIDTNNNSEVVANAIRATKKLVGARDIGFLLDIMRTTEDQEKRKAAEEVTAYVIRESKDTKSVARELKSALNKAETELSYAVFLRLLGDLGGDEAADVIKANLKTGDLKKVLPALGALKDWPDTSMTELTLEFWSSSTDAMIRKKAFDALFSMMGKYYLETPEGQPYWEKIAKSAENADEKNKVITGLASTKQGYAIKILEGFANDVDATVIRRAQKAIRAVKKAQEGS